MIDSDQDSEDGNDLPPVDHIVTEHEICQEAPLLAGYEQRQFVRCGENTNKQRFKDHYGIADVVAATATVSSSRSSTVLLTVNTSRSPAALLPVRSIRISAALLLRMLAVMRLSLEPVMFRKESECLCLSCSNHV